MSEHPFPRSIARAFDGPLRARLALAARLALLLTLAPVASQAGRAPAADAPPPASRSAPAMLSPARLLQRLRAGGCVIVMRHASSPFAAPAAGGADPGNTRGERQLDAQGKADARDLGAALRALRVPIDPVYSSPTFRALETIRLAQLETPRVVEALAESPQGMAGDVGQSQTDWLRSAVDQAPPAGSNTLIVTHTPNIAGAFGPAAGNIQAGEMLIFEPRRDAGPPARLLGRMTVADWRSLLTTSPIPTRRSPR